MTGTYRIILADDHVLFRQGLMKIMEGMPGLEVVGEAGDGAELVSLLNRQTCDMVILDLSMPGIGGIEVLPEIKRINPQAKILVLTMHNDKEYLYRALSGGVDGYFLKREADTQLSMAIEKIRQGKMYVSPCLSQDLINDLEFIKEKFTKPVLTPREKEVLNLVGEGKSNKDIANHLFVSVHTVERHRANIMSKLNLRGTADLIKYAIEKRSA